MSFIDQIIRDRSLPREMRQEMLNATVFRAKNVYQYLYENDKHPMIESLPSVAPPYKNMFIEWTPIDAGKIEVGCYVKAYDMAHVPESSGDLPPIALEQARWLLRGYIHLSFARSPQFFWEVLATAAGKIVSLEDDIFFRMRSITGSRVDHLLNERPDHHEDFTWFGLTAVEVPLWTIAFCHVKNVVREEYIPAPKLAKKAEKEHGLPPSRYYTLKIKPMRKVYNGEGKGTHEPPSVHIRRGHFKTFTEEKPLLGKAVGTFWWEAAMVGDAKRGVVAKDYEPVPDVIESP